MLQPSLRDIHQDHQVIAAEGLRAFKRTHDPRLRDPLEQLQLRLPGIRRAREGARRAEGARAREIRVAAAPPVLDPEYIWNVARTHGINVNREYAEVFEVYRVDGMSRLGACPGAAGRRSSRAAGSPRTDGGLVRAPAPGAVAGVELDYPMTATRFDFD